MLQVREHREIITLTVLENGTAHSLSERFIQNSFNQGFVIGMACGQILFNPVPLQAAVELVARTRKTPKGHPASIKATSI
jgi:hypothetical protein